MKRLAPTLLAFSILTSSSLYAQARYTENTLALETGTPPPAATLDDISWLEGHWTGEAFGGLAEEIWSAPRGGSMMGMYRHIDGASVSMYEILALVEESGSLVLKLKHFNPDLTGWEEKNEVRAFPLVKREAEKLYFDGMTFERLGPDEIRVFLAIDMRDGSVHEELFNYRRAGK